MCMSVCGYVHLSVLCLWNPEKVISCLPGAGVRSSCESLADVGAGSEPGPLQEHIVLNHGAVFPAQRRLLKKSAPLTNVGCLLGL